jgi:hypothetical protein
MDVDLSTELILAQPGRPGRDAGVTVPLTANLAATAAHFRLCRARVFRRPRPAQGVLIHPEGTDR